MDDLLPERRARLRVGTGAVVVLLLVGLGGAVLVSTLLPRTDHSTLVAPLEASGAPSVTQGILVHVLGAVATPGLYELQEGDRVVDAIALAGGLADGADPAGVNLARPLSDGEQLVVPLEGAAPVPGVSVGGDGKVNINTADAATLDTLPRVGPAMAERIIAWREANGGFSSIEDLLDVSGIGEATLDGMRDLVAL